MGVDLLDVVGHYARGETMAGGVGCEEGEPQGESGSL